MLFGGWDRRGHIVFQAKDVIHVVNGRLAANHPDPGAYRTGGEDPSSGCLMAEDDAFARRGKTTSCSPTTSPPLRVA